MSLSNQQIERYARQIIVPGIGGVAQERLLSARLTLAGKVADVATVLAYMVGAGVGEIGLQLPATEAAEQEPLMLIMSAAQLNPEVLVKPRAEDVGGLNLVLAIGGESETSELILPLHRTGVPVIFVRLDEPSIAILPGTPPCLLCADADLLAPFKRQSDTAGFVTMIAATEAIKLLGRVAPAPAPTLLQFNGFACATRRLRQTPLRSKCSCSIATEAR